MHIFIYESLSVNQIRLIRLMNHVERDDRFGQYHHRVIIARLLIVPNQQLAKTVMTRMRNFDNPPSCLSEIARPLFPFAFLATRTHVRDVTVVTNTSGLQIPTTIAAPCAHLIFFCSLACLKRHTSFTSSAIRKGRLQYTVTVRTRCIAVDTVTG